MLKTILTDSVNTRFQRMPNLTMTNYSKNTHKIHDSSGSKWASKISCNIVWQWHNTSWCLCCGKFIYLIPVAFEVAWLLAALSQPNHIVPLCSGASLACRLHASSIPLGIDSLNLTENEIKVKTLDQSLIDCLFNAEVNKVIALLITSQIRWKT